MIKRLLPTLLAALALLGCSSGDDDDSSSGSEAEAEAEETTTTVDDRPWEAQAEEAIEPVPAAAAEAAAQTDAWLAGDVELDDYRPAVRRAMVAASGAREALADLAEHDARELYVAAAQLYVGFGRLQLEAANLEPGAAQDDAIALAERLRVLGDHVTDRARAAAGVDAEPLASTLVPGDTDTAAATQPAEEWEAAVEDAGAPEAIDTAGDPGAQADAYFAAVDALRDEPAPDVEGGAELRARLLLDWLVKGETSRAAQLGFVVVSGPLVEVTIAPAS